MTIKGRLIVGFLGIAAIPSLFIGTLSLSSARKALEANQMEALKSIADLKADKIESFFKERRGDIKTAQDYYNIKTNLPVAARLIENRNAPDYIAAEKMLDGQLKTFQAVYGYVNLMLVSPEGTIVYGTNDDHDEIDLGHRLPDPGEKAFEEGKKGVYFSDIFRNASENGRFCMLITAPIHDFTGKFIGLVALEVDMGPIYQLIQNTTGLGKTGETLLGKRIGNEARFLNPLRHDPDAALVRRVGIGDQNAFPIQAAVQGENGSGFSVDYRGKEILAVWRYLPSLDWGMVAKIDKEEAFESITDLKRLTRYVAAFTLIVVLIGAILMANSIAKPILVLKRGMEIVGQGNLDHKVGTESKDEIGHLSRTFDQMTENLKHITSSRNELDLEVKEREEAQASLKALNETLEARVQERTEEAENRALALARSNEELQQFTSIASHDLQEPLRKVTAFASILQAEYGDKLDEDGVSMMNRMLSATERMQNLIDSLLSLTRVTTRAKAFRAIQLEKVVENILSDIEGLVTRTEGKVEVGPLPTIEGDAVQIYQLLQNMIGNGLKYHKKGEAPLVSVQSKTVSETQVEITVKDNGIGFDEKYLDRIFKPFQRLHGRSSVYEGTGMGLAICQKIVHRHHGEISATSAPGEGSTFIIRLPLVLSSDGDAACPVESVEAEARQTKQEKL